MTIRDTDRRGGIPTASPEDRDRKSRTYGRSVSKVTANRGCSQTEANKLLKRLIALTAHHEPPYTEPYVRWCGRTAGVIPPPTRWRYAADGHVGSFVVVCPEPCCCCFLYLLNCFKYILVQPVISDRPIIAFDVGILLWLSRLDKLQPDPTFLGPARQQLTDIFRTIIAPNSTRDATPLDDLVQRPDNAGRW